jgi:hypothetical protein
MNLFSLFSGFSSYRTEFIHELQVLTNYFCSKEQASKIWDDHYLTIAGMQKRGVSAATVAFMINEDVRNGIIKV